MVDLHRRKILRQFFALPYGFSSPDVIIDELEDLGGNLLLEYGLQKGALSGKRVLEVYELSGYNRNSALNDLFALVLAASIGVTLLTGDNRLRTLATKHNVQVHGTLWVLDEMVARNKLKPVEAYRALTKMLENESRLPLGSVKLGLKSGNDKLLFMLDISSTK